jgi:hypothetical protein
MDNQHNYDATAVDENGNIKEDFCGSCVAIPLALLGAGAAGFGANQKGGYKKTKQILLWGGLGLTLVSIIVAIIFLMKCKNCR